MSGHFTTWKTESPASINQAAEFSRKSDGQAAFPSPPEPAESPTLGLLGESPPGRLHAGHAVDQRQTVSFQQGMAGGQEGGCARAARAGSGTSQAGPVPGAARPPNAGLPGGRPRGGRI